MLSISSALHAQDDVEYRFEMGAGVNMTSYQGDFSDALFKNESAGATLLSRFILNPRSAVRLNLMLTKVKGEEANANTFYPDITGSKYAFSNTLGDFSVTYEYNFLPYGTGRDYRGAKRFTPFISLGLGLTYLNAKNGTVDYSAGKEGQEGYVPQYSSSKSVVTGNIPVGLGVKYKIKDRFNLTFDWQFHLSFSDYLDGVKDPYRIASTGLFKNTDCYSAFSLTLTYSLAPKCVTCHNDKE